MKAGEGRRTEEGGKPLAAERVAGGWQRYGRQMILSEVGVAGQERLRQASVLVVGAGGLGSPAALYLAAAGVGRIGVVDGDRVELSNLHRQILHATADLGRPKAVSAQERLRALNPEVEVEIHPVRLTSANALEILAGYDLVVNGSDNFPTRYLLSDACVLLGKPWVDASVLRWEGQVTVFLPGGGCYRCLFPSPPPPGSVPSCAQAGVMGAVTGVLGSLEAVEAIKLLLGVGRPLSSRLLLYDGLEGDFQELAWARNPACPACGDHPELTGLIDYEAFCGLAPGPEEEGGARARDSYAEGADGAKGGEGEEEVPSLAPAEAWRLLRQEAAQLVDVREPWEFAQMRIPGARSIPLGELPGRLGELEPGRPLLAVCLAGPRSAEAVRLLRRRGFRLAYNLEGGLLAWETEQLPLESDGP
ncbi:MAG: HesA/MoeB/ThiF family protein [Bacillota bacterium]|nr:HesA/MoeB/ThiF family protein [Bacillota bacterium]